MHIGINAHLLSLSQGYRNAGVGRYIYYVLRALAAREDDTRYTVFCHDAPPPGDPARSPHVRFAVSRLDTREPTRRILYEQAVLPWRLPGRYLLYLGTLEPRKNLTTLLRAYARLRRRGLDWPLVLAGGKGWLYEDIFRTIDALHLAAHVRLPGYVAYEEQPLWYGGATVFVYPSTYEGFGLPVLEAMACGTPVVTSTASSLPEAAGDAALLVECRDEEALTQAIERLAGDAALRADLVRRGGVRVA